jgi:CHAT domain-containing protein
MSRIGAVVRVAAVILACGTLIAAQAACAGELDRLIGERAAIFRRTGQGHPSQLVPVIEQLSALVQRSGEADKVRAQIELATTYSFAERFDQAIPAYEAAARAAGALDRRDLAFDALIGEAHDYDYGAHDLVAAAAAYEGAVSAAGRAPTPEQAYRLASLGAQLEWSRGELDAALVSVLEAAMLARTPAESLREAWDLGGVYLALAESCADNDQPLYDARSAEDWRWGACLRAAQDAEGAYADAQTRAIKLGLPELAREAGSRQPLIQALRAEFQTHAWPELFRDMLGHTLGSSAPIRVSKDFGSAPDFSGDHDLVQQFPKLSHGTTKEILRQSIMGEATERDDASQATAYYRAAANLMAKEPRNYFDPRRRGVEIQKFNSTKNEVALRLLARGFESEAFDVFESMRSRGLGEIAAQLHAKDITAANRAWLADVVRTEAQLSGLQSTIARRAIADGQTSVAPGELERLSSLRAHRADLLADTANRERFSRTPYQPVRLAEIRALVRKTGTPVLFYWVTRDNVIDWIETPDGSTIRSVDLDQDIVEELVERVRDGASDGAELRPFDVEAAEQLYAGLIEPFSSQLSKAGQLILVPQGELADLPFEALMNRDGRFLIERWAVSYAPNATMAAEALRRPARITPDVAAVEDRQVADDGIATLGPPAHVVLTPADTVGLAELKAMAPKASVLHLLAHGRLASSDPLLSTLKLKDELLAADLLEAPLADTQLAVLSACESGKQERLVSNELYGFPWALLAAGVQNAVVSRWLTSQTANARWTPAFYAGIGKGLAPAEAAAAASRGMIAEGHRDPHEWAAMQVIGR